MVKPRILGKWYINNKKDYMNFVLAVDIRGGYITIGIKPPYTEINMYHLVDKNGSGYLTKLIDADESEISRLNSLIIKYIFEDLVEFNYFRDYLENYGG